MIDLNDKYSGEAESRAHPGTVKEISAGWQSPSNIALIKYWGKKGYQLPANASLSITLSKAFTRTWLDAVQKKQKGISFDFQFEESVSRDFNERISRYLEHIKKYFPFLERYHLSIRSENSFPHSSGIASSASGFSALALCICSAEKELFRLNSDKDFFSKASFMARLGSGSASRSVYGGYVSWGQHEEMPASDDEVSTPFPVPVHPSFRRMRDAILIVSTSRKKTSSSLGHSMMDSHPFAGARYLQAGSNFSDLVKTLKSGDFSRFIQITENEALTLHAMMMSQDEGIILTSPNTFEMINRIRNFRDKSGEKLCFTLDAGPNIHLLYPDESRKAVLAFINDELAGLCEEGKWIDDEAGEGPFPII